MRHAAVALVLSLVAGGATLARGAASIPDWAYAVPAAQAARGAPPAPAAPDPTMRQLSGSTLTFTRQQIADGFGPADWFPSDHPAMPDIVAHGRRPDVRACALCHYPNGKGRQENAGIAGLPVSYFIQTMNDFRAGLRKSAEPRKANTNLMAAYAKAMTTEEIRTAAEYFGAMKWTPWVRVVETATVPRMASRGGMWMPIADAGTEPLGARVIETPEDPERTETLRDPRSGFVAYVPLGSVRKGEALSHGCATCHGQSLAGLGPVPGIAGRSPSYIARQLYDMQTGARSGEWTELMKGVVATMSNEELVNISAYLASR